jgi:UDP-3-O-[3-hydroxymyristoyl] glucosamine N-acyltransferase
MVESGSVIGSEGFGWAKDGERWVKVPQLGRVVIGNQVSIGANTCVDRGAIEDTVIESGVKLDNLIQISHNVTIGANTAMAGSSGVAGSTKVGKRCTIAGMAGVAGHLTIADDVHITAMTLVSHSLTEAGVYSGNLPVEPNAQWRKNVARFRQLDAMAKRLKQVEKRLDKQQPDA